MIYETKEEKDDYYYMFIEYKSKEKDDKNVKLLNMVMRGLNLGPSTVIICSFYRHYEKQYNNSTVIIHNDKRGYIQEYNIQKTPANLKYTNFLRYILKNQIQDNMSIYWRQNKGSAFKHLTDNGTIININEPEKIMNVKFFIPMDSVKNEIISPLNKPLPGSPNKYVDACLVHSGLYKKYNIVSTHRNKPGIYSKQLAD